MEQDCSQPKHKDRGDKSCRCTRIIVIVCLPESIASKVRELWSIWTPIVWTVVIFTDVAYGGRDDIVEGHGPPRLVVVVIDEDRCRLLVGHPVCAESLNRGADLNTRYRVEVDHNLCVLLLRIHSLHSLVSETEDWLGLYSSYPYITAVYLLRAGRVSWLAVKPLGRLTSMTAMLLPEVLVLWMKWVHTVTCMWFESDTLVT